MVDLIIAKRRGHEHSRPEIDFIVEGITGGTLPDYQVAAWLMAVCWQGMTIAETAHLTDAVCHSGETLDLSEIGPVVADKHSTGGVGDKTTIVFVPMMAAAGVPMAKLSGRGLGHTGGTIDKLEAIPGFKTDLSVQQFVRQVKEIKMAIGGQTPDLAPADGKMYALRDVTGTVESIPLIAASVVSKKLAAGANLIILDVKCGRGAFMDNEEKATQLAKVMAEVGTRLKRPITAVVTDMEQPLGNAIGHTLEVIEAIETLRGQGPPDLQELCYELGSLALVKAGKAADEDEARAKLEKIINEGTGIQFLRQLIAAQGGDPRVVEDYSLMPASKQVFEFRHAGIVGEAGDQWVAHLDGRKVAEACKLMGAGRAKKGDPIDLAVGVLLRAKVGSKVQPGDVLAEVHAQSKEQFELASAKLKEAFTFSDSPVAVPSVIKGRAS